MIRAGKRNDENVEIPDDLLSAYTATQLPGGRPTGLPAPSSELVVIEDAPPVPAVVREALPSFDPFDARTAVRPTSPRSASRDLRPVEERRLERRHPLTVPVAATQEGSESTMTGVTIDVSSSGILLEMPAPPPEAHLDVVVGDDGDCSLLWCKVRRHRPAPNGWYWHIRVVAADDAWEPIVRRASGADVAVGAKR